MTVQPNHSGETSGVKPPRAVGASVPPGPLPTDGSTSDPSVPGLATPDSPVADSSMPDPTPPTRTRVGKIARLPRVVRDELNRRLQDGEPGVALVQWLNNRDDVRAVLAAHFGGRAISPQNLSDWTQGGYTQWLVQQELLEQVREATEENTALGDAAGPVTELLASALAARFALALREWDGREDSPSLARLRSLGEIARQLYLLRQGDQVAERVHLQRAYLNLARNNQAHRIYHVAKNISDDPDFLRRNPKIAKGLPPEVLARIERQLGVFGPPEDIPESEGGMPPDRLAAARRRWNSL